MRPITYYLPQAHNLGIIFDGSGHFRYRRAELHRHRVRLRRFAVQVPHQFVLAVLPPDGGCGEPVAGVSADPAELRQPVECGAGMWAAVSTTPSGRRFSIRVAQADYIYTNYSPYIGVQYHIRPSGTTCAWSTGVIFNLGSYYTPQPTAACTAQPTEVIEGEPVTVTATGTNFNPKHTVMYSWTTNGGKLNSSDKPSAQIDTTGVAAGSYTANASLTDPKINRHLDAGSHSFIGTPDPIKPATCSANYTVKAKPMNPPQVSCSVNPSTVQGGGASTITATASSPDNSPISSYSYTASAGKISGTGTTATLDTAGLPAGPVTVTRHRDGCPQPDRHRHLLGGRRSTAATADLQQDQLHPVPGSEETVACGQHCQGHPGRRSQPSEG